ncbi:MAG: hypothetical protein ACR65R_04185 [Methylomicrobium sp.]
MLLVDSNEFVCLVNNLDEINRKRLDNLARSGAYTVPTCVRCEVKMVKRKAKTGENAGGNFRPIGEPINLILVALVPLLRIFIDEVCKCHRGAA